VKETQGEIQSKLDAVKTKLEAKKQEFDIQVEDKESDVKSNVEE